MAVTIIYDEKPLSVSSTAGEDGDLWLSLADLGAVTGWEVKPEEVCRQDLCVPVPEDRRASFLGGEGSATQFNLAEFASLIEQPIARDDDHGVWYFGRPGWEWKAPPSGVAPDFTLPDFQGRTHSLSEFRGKKVFLLCWASR